MRLLWEPAGPCLADVGSPYPPLREGRILVIVDSIKDLCRPSHGIHDFGRPFLGTEKHAIAIDAVLELVRHEGRAGVARRHDRHLALRCVQVIDKLRLALNIRLYT